MWETENQRMESMAEEFNEMLRIKLFDADKIKKIKLARRGFESKINNPTMAKNKDDIRDYIQHEKNLLREIRLIRDKKKIAEKKGSIDYKILQRIKRLYEIAIKRFSNDCSIYLAYFKFCKQSTFQQAASTAIQAMVKNFSHNEEVWKIAATWYAYDRKDIATAISTLHKGLSIHKRSCNLYKAAIELELKYTKEKKDEPNIELCCKKIEAYRKELSENVNDVSSYVEILKLLEEYDFTKGIQDKITDVLLEKCKDDELVWHTIAQRERKGIHNNYLFPGDNHSEKVTSTKQMISNCIHVYKEGLRQIHPAKKSNLWSYYLDCLIELQQENKHVANVTRVKALKEALKEAVKENVLQSEHFLLWLELVDDNEAEEVILEGIKALPGSVELWKSYLRYAIMTENSASIEKIFNDGVIALKERSLPLWLLLIRYYTMLGKEDKIEATYLRGIAEVPEICQVLKPKYIEWLALMKDISRAREQYLILARRRPYCKEMHAIMDKLESTEIDFDFKSWEKVHQLACEQFGEDDDVWLNYINFYRHYNNKIDNLEEKIAQIASRARATLPTIQVSSFNENFIKLACQ